MSVYKLRTPWGKFLFKDDGVTEWSADTKEKAEEYNWQLLIRGFPVCEVEEVKQ